MGQNLPEKIFSAHCGREVHTGDTVIAELDLVMAHDTTGAWAIDPFREIADKVFDPERIVFPFDHAFPAPSVAMAHLQKKVRTFAKEQGIRIRTDGVCHQLLAEEYVKPSMLVLGADSHTPTSGGLGALTIGVGSTDAAVALATGKNWFRVPEVIRIVIEGEMPHGVFAKDVILHIAGMLGTEYSAYKIIEFAGPVVEQWSVPERMTLTNMCAELGAKTAIVPSDERTREYLTSQGREDDWEANGPDPDAEYAETIVVDVSDLVPTVAQPHDIDQEAKVEDIEGRPVDQVFIGSCTNGRIEDLRVVRSIWEGRELNRDIRVVITPASRRVYLQALEEGLVEFFMKKGVSLTNPGCGACLGRQGGVLDDEEVCVATSNRNFPGRMGSPTAEIYLASPATAAATALRGVITDPRPYLPQAVEG